MNQCNDRILHPSLGWEDAMLRRKWKEFPIVEKPGPVQVVKCK